MRRLLLVEDDSSLGETLQERLAKEGYDVKWVESQQAAEVELGLSGSPGAAPASHPAFDLIVLDVGLPDGSGFELARRLREGAGSERDTPFLFITAMNTAENRLEGYEIGAEEFIPKPFHLKELLIRVRHVLETHADGKASNEVHVGELKIDLDAQAILRAGGEREFLATRDFQVLKLLIEEAPRVVSRDEILNRVWGEDKFPSHRTVDNAIVRLRQALGDSGAVLIRSVRGVGYQWAK
jgi:DNA-binding response OmpR family regulator